MPMKRKDSAPPPSCDISTPKGLEKAPQENRIMTVCPKLVKDAVEILEEIL
jgi:hypothetical protein